MNLEFSESEAVAAVEDYLRVEFAGTDLFFLESLIGDTQVQIQIITCKCAGPPLQTVLMTAGCSSNDCPANGFELVMQISEDDRVFNESINELSLCMQTIADYVVSHCIELDRYATFDLSEILDYPLKTLKATHFLAVTFPDDALLKWQDRSYPVFSVVPVFKNEIKYLHGHGMASLLELFEEHGVDRAVHLDRRSAC